MTAWFKKAGAPATNARAPLDSEAAAGKLRGFIAAKSKLIKESEIATDTKLFSSGLLDSLAFIELVLFVEKEFHIKLSDVSEVNMESLDSIEQILGPVTQATKSA